MNCAVVLLACKTKTLSEQKDDSYFGIWKLTINQESSKRSLIS